MAQVLLPNLTKTLLEPTKLELSLHIFSDYEDTWSRGCNEPMEMPCLNDRKAESWE